MKRYDFFLGAAIVLVYASAVKPEPVNTIESSVTPASAEQSYYLEVRNEDGSYTRTGTLPDGVTYHDHFQANGKITRTFSSQPTGSTSQIPESIVISDKAKEWFNLKMLQSGCTQQPNGVWRRHFPGEVAPYEHMGYTRTPGGIWYKTLSRNVAGESVNMFLAFGPDSAMYSDILPPGTNSLDDASLFEFMGYTKTLRGIWYKIAIREVTGDWVNDFIVVDPDGKIYTATGIVPLGTTSIDEATLFQILGYTGTPRGIWYKIIPSQVAGGWVNDLTAVDPDGVLYTATGIVPPGTTNIDEATLFQKMGYTGTPRGFWYKIVPRELAGVWLNGLIVVGPDGVLYTATDNVPLGTTSIDEATLFQIMGYTRTLHGIWYKIVPREVGGGWVNDLTAVGPDGVLYTATVTTPLDTTTIVEATLCQTMGFTETPHGIWYKMVTRQFAGGRVYHFTAVSLDGRLYTATYILPLGGASANEVLLHEIRGNPTSLGSAASGRR